MTTLAAARVRASWPARAALGGVILGAAYALSPLTVLSIVALWFICARAVAGLSGRERRWVTGMLVAAVAFRVVPVAALFLFGDTFNQPYASFFGDEDFFKQHSMWARNVGLGIPISPADFIYLFDDVGQTSYVELLAVLQAMVGESPYGIHLLNITFYIGSALLLHRVARTAFGRAPALLGLAALLFLPSLFLWSLSALKEPLYALVAAAELVCAMAAVRAGRPWQRVLAIAGVLVFGVWLETLRKGGMIIAVAGAAAGIAAGLTIVRPRLMAAVLLVGPVLAGGLLALPAVREPLLAGIRTGAFYHSGHIWTDGRNYKLLGDHYYADRQLIHQMPVRDTVRFAGAALVGYFTVPVPWKLESRRMIAYLPEQLVWYVMVALLPLGILAGLRRDALLTCLLLTHAGVAILLVALTSGNVGTLVRHRGLAVPYLVWVSALGAYELVRRVTPPVSTKEVPLDDGC